MMTLTLRQPEHKMNFNMQNASVKRHHFICRQKKHPKNLEPKQRSSDMLQNYLHFKSSEGFISHVSSLGILGTSVVDVFMGGFRDHNDE